MGNQNSKGPGTGSPNSASQTSLDKGLNNLQSYPSFGKADTKESTRSFRGALKSKIPGAKTDSPRGSIVGLPNGEGAGDKSEVSSTKVGRNVRSTLSRTGQTDEPDSPTSPVQDSADNGTSPLEDPKPPPSPIQSASMRTGHHDVDAAQRSGEIDHVSDQPPSGTTNPYAHLQRAGASILVKRANTINPIQEDALVPIGAEEGNTSTSLTMAMGELKDSDVDDYIKRLLDAGYAGKSTKGVCLRNAEISSICSRVRELFLDQPPLIELDAPVKIVGDIHGQYSDLIRMFEMCGFPPTSNFLFLGDYVDRGKHSLETILLLMCYKIKYPENFFLLRGNHECANVTRVYGFYDECKRRCNVKVWKTFVDTFNCVSVAIIA